MVAEKFLLIDTDPGIDDCAALMMALKKASSKVKIVGITCASGNVGLDQVQANIARILKLCGMLGKIPIFRGSLYPMVALPTSGDASYWHGRDGLGEKPDVYPPATPDLMNYVESESAIDAITRLSKEYEGRLQLLCLGPLTNIALAERIDPELPKRLKSIHILGGTMRGCGNHTPIAEYNFVTDPEAAYNVLRQFSTHCHIQIVTYELTLDHGIPRDWHDDLLASKGRRATFYRSVHQYSRMNEDPDIKSGKAIGYTPHDAYLVATVLDPDIITKSKMVHVGVELFGVIARGAFVIDHRDIKSPQLTPKPIELIEKLDMDGFKRLFAQAMQD